MILFSRRQQVYLTAVFIIYRASQKQFCEQRIFMHRIRRARLTSDLHCAIGPMVIDIRTNETLYLVVER